MEPVDNDHSLKIRSLSSARPNLLEIKRGQNNSLILVVTNPSFALFIEALYQDAIKNPEKLWASRDVWADDIEELIEGVEINEED